MVASAGRLKAGDLVKRPPLTISPKATLLEAVDTMTRYNVGALVVVRPEDPERAVAVISERDIVKALSMRMALSTPVEAFMSTGVISVDAEEPASRVAELMWRYNIRHVVVTRGGKLHGVVSIRDLVKPDVLRSLCNI